MPDDARVAGAARAGRARSRPSAGPGTATTTLAWADVDGRAGLARRHRAPRRPRATTGSRHVGWPLCLRDRSRPPRRAGARRCAAARARGPTCTSRSPTTSSRGAPRPTGCSTRPTPATAHHLRLRHARARRPPRARRARPARRDRRGGHRLRQLPRRRAHHARPDQPPPAARAGRAGPGRCRRGACSPAPPTRRQTLLPPELVVRESSLRGPTHTPAPPAHPPTRPRRHHEEPSTSAAPLPALCLAATTALALTACGGSRIRGRRRRLRGRR